MCVDDHCNYFLFIQVIYSVSPPGLYYKDPPMVNSVNFTSDCDWESSIRAPVFTDGAKAVSPAEFDERSVLVLDIRTIDIDKGVRLTIYTI